LSSGSYEGCLVECTYYLLSSDIAVVFHVEGNRLYFCIVLFVSDFLFMPVNSLYCAVYAVV